MSLLPQVHPVGVPAIPPNLAPAAVPEYAEAMVAAADDAAPAGMTFGAAVLDLATGDLAQTGEEEFYSASLSKLILIVDMLDRNVELSDADLSLIDCALSLSDDNAMNALWVKFDGPSAMTRVADALGMPGTSTPDDPSQWGETEVSPAGYARLFQHILTEMDPGDRAMIVDGLSAAEPRAADGFDQFFGLLGQPVQVYAKQGWMYYGSRLYLHSAGVVHTDIRDYVVVLMSIQPVAAADPAAVTAVASAMLAPLNG
jgi:beta-lactamase family protein